MLFTNLLLNTDSYKLSHWKQYKEGISHVNSYIESRGGKYDKTVFFGLQAFIKEYLLKPITLEDIKEAKELWTAHGEPFNEEGWLYVLNVHKGYLPLQISAVPEGTVLPTNNVLVQIVNTDKNCYWLTSYIETALLRAIWYPTTVATNSWHIKELILKHLHISSDNPEQEINFKLHDFGARGVSSLESAAIGGMSHLVNFMGTDTFSGVLAAKKYYNEPMAGFSIPAAEHSTITSWGKENERDAYENMLTQFSGPGKLVAVVSDSYDIYNAVEKIWGEELKEKVINNGGTIVIRPDSGDPATVILKVISLLDSKFGHYINKKGYKVLPDYVRVIQGDGINQQSIDQILTLLEDNKYSATNIAFGMGGALLHQLNRDTLKFAMKCSAVKINGQWKDVNKDPVDDHNKASKKGRLALIYACGLGSCSYRTIKLTDLHRFDKNLLEVVYEDGKLLKEYNFSEIRNIANSSHTQQFGND